MAKNKPSRLASFFHRYRVERLLFFAFWLSFSFFFHLKPGWNVNTRLGLTMAMVDHGTFSIDMYHRHPLTETEDKAFVGGHYYCDKSPALSFIAAPFYWVVRGILKSYPSEYHIIVSRQWCIIWTVALLGALGMALFFRLMRSFGATGEEGLALTFFLAYGTILGGYASLLFPYLPATACMIGAYLLARGLARPGAAASGYRLGAIGFLISMAWFFEFTFGLAGAILTIYVAALTRPRRKLIWLPLAAAPPIIALFAYNYSIFGRIALAYEFEAMALFQNEMQKGFMGISTPKLAPLYYITVHPYKGLFFYSPFLLFFFLGSVCMSRIRAGKLDLALAWAVLIGYLAFNAGYYMWWGGWAFGARHLIPALPFLFAPVLAAMRRDPRVGAIIFFAGCVAVLLHLPPIAVDPQIESVYPIRYLTEPRISYNFVSPWLTDRFPRFYAGEVALNPFSFLPGLLCLAPLAVLWAIVLPTAWRLGREEDGPAGPTPISQQLTGKVTDK